MQNYRSGFYQKARCFFLIFLSLLSFFYALPNLYGEDPTLHISPAVRGLKLDATVEKKVLTLLDTAQLPYKKHLLKHNDLLIRFHNTDAELKAKDLIRQTLGTNYTILANLEPATPTFFSALGATPMKLGLDLRGGLHFLLEVDVDSVFKHRLAGVSKDVSLDLRERRLRYAAITETSDHGIMIDFREPNTRDKAYQLMKDRYPDFLISSKNSSDRHYLLYVKLMRASIQDIRQYTIEQTATILRNRVNELGVGEAMVQQQGANRISVDLPGIQDPGRAKRIIGGTATLAFRMVDNVNNPEIAKKTILPIGSKLYEYNQAPILLKTDIILTGKSIISAAANFDSISAMPAVTIQLASGDSNFSRVTQRNIGKLMAIVFVETKNYTRMVSDKPVHLSKREERIISVATIQGALGNNFQITGLTDMAEAKQLALLLRAGALPTNIIFVEERLVGPSLGLENIKRGLISLAVGMGLILFIMAIYYRMFGLIANVALIMNLVLLTAALSLIGATLTLPGLAGIVLTVGMAVDANVLIYERIREELRRGANAQVAIHAGYDRAFSTIVDANVTTLIVALVLFSVGTGAIQGFAVTLTIGLITSMITGITFTRAMAQLCYPPTSKRSLSVGI